MDGAATDGAATDSAATGDAAAARDAARQRPRGWLRRLKSALGLAQRKRRAKARTADDRAIAWLWPYLALTVKRDHPPLYENRDLLILQMGRVASISLQEALRTRGYNAYHSHGISEARRRGQLERLERSGTDEAAIIALGSHVHALAHHELLRWYQRHKTRNGERLRIITLTRDPVSWMSSHLVLLKQYTVPAVRRWYAAEAGLDPAQPIDDAAAMRAYGAALGRLILEARPSRGVAGAIADLRRIAGERWRSAPDFLAPACGALGCAEWFGHEIRPLFGIDVLADPALRETGMACVETDYVRIAVLRFEDLRRNADRLAGFLGLPELALPHVNATARGDDRAALRAAFEAGIEQAGGPAVRRELRNTEYGRACGYDSLSD